VIIPYVDRLRSWLLHSGPEGADRRAAGLTLRSLPAGRFIYLCDNFCGDEHDRMTGVLTVI